MNFTNIYTSFAPFLDITSYLMALIIIKKIYCKRKNNFMYIHKVLSHFVNQSNESQTKTFIGFILANQKQYNNPFDFINNIDKFHDKLYKYCLKEKHPSLIIDSPANMCEFCAISSANWYVYNSPQFFKNGILYGVNRIGKQSLNYCFKNVKNKTNYNKNIEQVRINVKQCKRCLNFHFISYAINNNTKKKSYFKEAHISEYFHFTNETFMEIKLLKMMLADLVFKQASYKGFADAYNYMNGDPSNSRFKLCPKRLAQIFYCFELCKFYHENDLGIFQSKFNCIPSLFQTFISKFII
jgi:hypothetical protein